MSKLVNKFAQKYFKPLAGSLARTLLNMQLLI